MALCPMKPLLEQAKREKRAVGAFNVGNMEILLGVVRAAEESGAPIILQIAEKRLRHSPLHLMAPMMVSAAKNAKVAIAVQLDHGCTLPVIHAAMDYGFTSVMFDGSALSLRENIRQTREISEEAARRGVNVEAEIGVIGGSEGGTGLGISCADPDEAVELGKLSGCDALAVAIGNAHGHYQGRPKLQFDVLEHISSQLAVPLVLHGGTGIPDEDFRRAISLGICKINIATSSFDAFVSGAKNYLETHPQKSDYFGMNEEIVESVCENVKRFIRVFNNREE